MLHGPRADGEPQRSDCRRGDHNCLRPCRTAGGAGLDRARADTPRPVTLAPTKATTAPISSRRCATRPSSRMWHRTPPAAARRSTTTPPVIPATRSPSASANASRKPLARCGIAGCSRWIGNSPWRWPPMTSSACPNCSLRLSDDPPEKSKEVPLLRRLPFDLRKARLPPQSRSSWKSERAKLQHFSVPC